MKKEKIHLFTDSDLKKRDKKKIKEISKFAICMVLAGLKDTGYVQDDPEILQAEYKRMQSWFVAWEDHLISIKDIQKIIERDTGMEVRIRNE